jgi:hypothetical protein
MICYNILSRYKVCWLLDAVLYGFAGLNEEEFIPMRHSLIFIFLVIFNLTISLSSMIRAQELIRINEFMAVNNNGLDDEDRDESDWIEIYNAGMDPVNLEGWYLTDAVENLTKWAFPDVNLEPDAYLVVFASGKNRRDPLGELHTNFKLNGDGEYLGLVRPDGVTVAWDYFPRYPIQAPDISYGPISSTMETTLIMSGALAKAIVPFNDTLEPDSELSEALRPWTEVGLDDLTWQTGTTGVGYDYPGLIGLDVSLTLRIAETSKPINPGYHRRRL